MKITLTTYRKCNGKGIDNTVYALYVEKFGKNHHLGFVNAKEINKLLPNDIEDQYNAIHKPTPEQESLNMAIGAMIKQDRTYFTDDRGNHRDGLD